MARNQERELGLEEMGKIRSRYVDIKKRKRCKVCVCERERNLGKGGWNKGCRL